MNLSIIIPVFNNHEMTTECIHAIRQTVQEAEIVLVDNGSTPAYEKPYVGFLGLQLIRNEENKGFPAAVNQGIAVATGDIIVLLNNDVIVTPGWAEKLTAPLTDPTLQYSIVGPVTNYAAGLQAVQIETYENEQELAKCADAWAEHWQDAIEDVNFVIGFCMAFPKALWEELGPFDESLWPCSGEEVDFCFRAREAGHRIGIVKGCYVHHDGSQTFKAMEADGTLNYRDACEASDKHLAAKWGADYWERQSVSAVPKPHGLCLNLGCGYRKLDGFVNIDNRPECEPDLCQNILKGLPYAESSVDMVRADDFLEHVPQPMMIAVIEEIWRVLKPGGLFASHTPSTDGRGAFQDPTHVSFWNRNSWFYYSDAAHRNLYGITAAFDIESITDTEPDANGVIHTDVLARARK